MGYNQRGKRDGTGPYRGSYRRRVEGKTVGRRGGCSKATTKKKVTKKKTTKRKVVRRKKK